MLCLLIISPFEAKDQNQNCDTKANGGIVDPSLNDLDQEDQALIDIVKTLIISPDKSVPYNLREKDQFITMRGQWDQVTHLVQIFGAKKRDGFFIEAGAHDGVEASNTLYLEKKMGWRGLLVEPNPDTFAELLSTKRKSFAFGYCLSTTTTPQIVDFDASGMYGGIINNEKRLSDSEISLLPSDLQLVDHHKINRRTIKAQCFPLYSLITALGNPKIDVLSLDIEGAEFQVLKSIPWDKVDISVLLIEVKHFGEIFEGQLSDLETFLDEKGYKYYMTLDIDNIYVKKDFKFANI